MAREDRWGGGGGPASDAARQLDWAGGTLGFALGGFFDGILLHQILQWHHVLSGLGGPMWRSLRVQVLADGLFHAVMYGIALVGLWLLWRSRRAAPESGGKRFGGAFLIGFGLWHVVDAVINHWLLGLHHIRMNAESVLFWDMAFFLLGLVVLAAGTAIWRTGRAGGSGPGVSTKGKSSGRTAFMLGLAVVLAGAWALRPNPDGLVTAVFPAGASDAALRAIAEADGRLVWLDAQGGVAVFALPEGARGGWQLYRAGALFVSGTVSPPGCFAFARPPA
ncbi:DUF2243 domain-containing protein [Pedomonas mirosovicensis]|uniref:DUF2243 domain-containing protein n=1 Tax=Pedomonas mirosovicensis TaxID=2908641 RepID=UPI00216854BC|nr:DUF2243 domain-containing protein [Pedomonas mirosovicensis]MCH8684522.1 DUF2243 domain-containing protein [Pedomonas mirosovicensis]